MKSKKAEVRLYVHVPAAMNIKLLNAAKRKKVSVAELLRQLIAGIIK
jgi:hypothetical protein